MARFGILSASCAALVTLLVPPAVAQQASGIAGQVKDTTGAILPGVTVEATSPALIEKVRTVLTDGQGRYNVVDLRPGNYVVTFTLAGFNSVRREGIVLTGGFTATVDAEMQVGELSETITVSGASPVVDMQNVRQQTLLTRDRLDALPTGMQTFQSLVALTPGFGSGFVDVGGSRGAYRSNSLASTFHGKASQRTTVDGMRIQAMEGSGGGQGGYMPSSPAAEEMTLQTTGHGADSVGSGTVINVIPREGGNTFSGGGTLMFTDERLQSDNLSDTLKARGLTTVNKVLDIWDQGATLGGPIKRDKLWFFTAHRRWGNRNQQAGSFWNKTQGAPVYTPDLAHPGDRDERFRSHSLRLTWQASAKNKISSFIDVQDNITTPVDLTPSAPEALVRYHLSPDSLYQATWNSVATNRLLFEAGVSFMLFNWAIVPQSGVLPNHISTLDLLTGRRYNAYAFSPAGGGYGGPHDSNRQAQRFSASYVTGSHALKAGIYVEEGQRDNSSTQNGDMSYSFLGTVPSAIQQYATPYRVRENVKADVGLFVQDRWTIQQLTLNLGLRFESFNAYVPEQHLPAGAWVPARDFAAIHDVPNWKDLQPRVSAAYDLFGDGRTALKASLSRYLALNANNLTQLINPVAASVSIVERTWADANGNYVPDCDLLSSLGNGECGAFSNQNFGRSVPSTRYADDVLHGFGVRDYLWEIATEVQRELRPGLSMNVGYYHTRLGNFMATDNLLVSPADYSPYCIAAPRDARLPGGGGYEICGLYDIAPALFGRVDNLVTRASHYGKQSNVSDFVGVSFSSQFRSGLLFGGGLDTGRTVADTCFVVDSPEALRYCRIATPFKGQTDIKMYASYPLPADFHVSATFQNVSGPVILANYSVPNSQIAPSLGRNLAACGTRAVCSATTTVALIEPQTGFESRRTQLDLRVSKIVKVKKLRFQANLDLYNALNSSAIAARNNTFGSNWGRPTLLLDGRLIQLGFRATF